MRPARALYTHLLVGRAASRRDNGRGLTHTCDAVRMQKRIDRIDRTERQRWGVDYDKVTVICSGKILPGPLAWEFYQVSKRERLLPRLLCLAHVRSRFADARSFPCAMGRCLGPRAILPARATTVLTVLWLVPGQYVL